MHFSFPNFLSMSRLLAAPLLVVVFWLPRWTETSEVTADVAAMCWFGLAAATDFMDGYFARRNHQQSRLGEILDPTADKFLVITALLLLLESGRADFLPCWLIIGREVLMSATREWAAAHFSVATRVSKLGKIKTGAQIIAVLCLFANDSVWGIEAHFAGVIFLWIAVLLSLWSMGGYCRAIWLAYMASLKSSAATEQTAPLATPINKNTSVDANTSADVTKQTSKDES